MNGFTPAHPSNRYAFMVAEAVARAPGRAYNPLYLYGPAGAGKTSLLREVVGRQGHLVHLWLTGHDLRPRTAARSAVHLLKRRSTLPDVLVIDDLDVADFAEGGEDLLQELFDLHHLHRRQILIAAEMPPRQIPGLSHEMQGRLGWGLIADMHPS